MRKVRIADASVPSQLEGLYVEEHLQQKEEEKQHFSKMQHDSRIRSRVYERLLTEQQVFWKGELAEKEERLRTLEREREEWRSREAFWIGEMETVMQEGTDGTSWVIHNFTEAYKRLEEGMASLENMKLAPGDKTKRAKERRWRKKERQDRMESRGGQREEYGDGDSGDNDDGPRGSLLLRSSGANVVSDGNDEQTWNQQTERMDGKWGQVKRILEGMRENMEQRGMLGSAELRQDYVDLHGRLSVCRRSMDRVRREMDDTRRRREFTWRRLGLRMQMGGGREEEEKEEDEGTTPPGLEVTRSSPRQTPPRGRRGRSRGRQTQKDEV